MKDTTLSKSRREIRTYDNAKQGKYGIQFAFTPQFQKELYAWVKSQDGTYMNLNVKVWDDKPDAHNQAKGNGYAPKDVYDDELPPF